MVFRINFTFVLLFLFSSTISSQNWFPNETQNPNFFELQSNFNEYWKNKEVEKGKGFKQFKRWEWYWEKRVKPDGSFYPAGITMDNFNDYLRSKGKNSERIAANWESLGPSNTSGGYAGTGRINSIAFHPTNSNIIYVGAAGGGLWQSNDNGTSWFTNTDNLATLGVSAILVHPTNPDIIYIGTGDGDAADNWSVGVLKSTDGGVTFNTTGLNWTSNQNRLIRRMVFDPDDYNTILAATSDGIYRTTNSGTNWSNVQNGNFHDIEANPIGSSNTFYASSNGDIFRSTNNAQNWTFIQNIDNTNRIALAVTPANSNYVYALCSRADNSGFRGLFRSTNSGANYNQRSTTPNVLGWQMGGGDSGGQGWYDLIIAADPTNAEIIHIGGVNSWKSINGGTNWTITSHWASGSNVVHADRHAFEWQNNTTLWQGTDGGVYKTINGGTSWSHFSNGLVTSQMYKLGVSQTDSKAITGLQDNGTKLRNNNGIWSDAIGGDGMECLIDHSNSQTQYASLYFGDFFRSDDGGFNWTGITGDILENGNWITPIVIDPISSNTIYSGYSQLYKSTNKGGTWTSIGNFSNGDNLDYIAVAPSNTNYIYAGTSYAIWRTTNGGTAWNAVNVPTSQISMIAIHPTNPDILWATCYGYLTGEKVFFSNNGGTSWTNYSGSLPNISANCIVYQEGSNNRLYIGMDVGIFYRDSDMHDWEIYNEQLPNVEITELDINYFDSKIYASTYGRGLWVSELINSCERPREVEISAVDPFAVTFTWENSEIPSNEYEWSLRVGPNPPASGTAISINSQQVTGLLSNTEYYFFVRANCGVGLFSPWATYKFKHKYICSGENFDTGGVSNNYSNYEDFVDVICPGTNDSAIRLTFNSFNTEANWDALYIHNGKDVNAPLIASNNYFTSGGFPPGGFHGNTSIGPFTSTDTTGCLTLHFLSDDNTTRAGWNVSASCVTLCSPNGVTNTTNNGWGSLRRAIACSDLNDTLRISPQLTGQTIVLNNAIIIDKNLNILQSAGSMFKIEANSSGPVFNILSGNTLSLSNLELYSGTGFSGRAIINAGTLNLNNLKIYEHNTMPSNGSVIHNIGTINFFELNEIKK